MFLLYAYCLSESTETHSQTYISPFYFPVDAAEFNYSVYVHSLRVIVLINSVIFGAVTIFGIISWAITPADKWLRKDLVANMSGSANTDVDAPVHHAA